MIQRLLCAIGLHGRFLYVGRMWAGYTDDGRMHYRGRYLCEHCQAEHWASHYEPMSPSQRAEWLPEGGH